MEGSGGKQLLFSMVGYCFDFPNIRKMVSLFFKFYFLLVIREHWLVQIIWEHQGIYKFSWQHHLWGQRCIPWLSYLCRWLVSCEQNCKILVSGAHFFSVLGDPGLWFGIVCFGIPMLAPCHRLFSSVKPLEILLYSVSCFLFFRAGSVFLWCHLWALII